MDLKDLSRRFINVWNEGNVNALDDILDANLVEHDPGRPPGLPPGREGAKAMIQMYRAAFPDVHMKVEDIVVEGDRAAMRWTGTGTNTGPMMGMPATGKKVTVTGMNISRAAGGKFVESWGNWDQIGMLTQLGIIPPMGPK